MSQDIQLRERPLRSDHHADDSSEATDYADDPHVYNNMRQYIMSILGVCVGFGSFWRFPYLVYKNGGGVFLIPYFTAMAFIGIPLLYLETAIGQMHRLSIPFIFKQIHPSLKIIGLAIMTATFHFSTSYNILLVYCYRFMFAAFQNPIPFADQTITQNKYFHQKVLHQSDSINDFGTIDPLLLVLYMGSMFLCHYIIKDGAKTSGKIVVVTASTPFFILFILVIRGLFLEGALDGIIFLFKPKWGELWNYTIWIDGITQVFYQMALGYGMIVNLSTGKAKRGSILQSVFLVPTGFVLCGLLSALTIFTYLSHFCVVSGFSINDPQLKLSGMQLSFNVLPKALMLLPMPNLWIFIFFTTMVLLGIDSQFGLIETIYCYVRDQFKDSNMNLFGFNINYSRAQLISLLLMCVAAPTLTSQAGIYYLQFYDTFMSSIPWTVWLLVELYFFVHLVPLDSLVRVVFRYTKEPTPILIVYCLKSTWLPCCLVANLLLSIYNQLFAFQKYTFWFAVFGWLITLYPMILIYLVLRKQWPGWSALKLTIEDSVSKSFDHY